MAYHESMTALIQANLQTLDSVRPTSPTAQSPNCIAPRFKATTTPYPTRYHIRAVHIGSPLLTWIFTTCPELLLPLLKRHLPFD